MKIKIFILAAALVFALSAPGFAIAFEDIQHGVEVYNRGAENAPDILKTLLGDERVQIEISKSDGTVLLAGLETKDGLVVNTTEGEIEDPTIEVNGSEEAIIGVIESDDPVAAFEEAKDQGEISIEGKTWSARLKVAAALSSTEVLRFLATLLGK
ncbi:MAG TPA: hypothetical protein PLZ42_01560 [Methanothrix sp.]|nr:hypothetical protein [Methanothrix sp.]